jgi:hypothetical protein
MNPFAVVWPLLTLLAAAGLCAIAPPRIRSLYIAPVGCTMTVIFLAVAYTAAIWSH